MALTLLHMEQEQLTQYVVALQFCSRIFQNSPDEDLLRGVIGGGLLQGFGAWSCFRPSELAEKLWGEALDPEGRTAALTAAYPAEAAQDSCRALYLELSDVLGIPFTEKKDELTPEQEALFNARKDARKAKNWAESDRIRDELKAQGILVEDTPQGMKWKRI